MMIVVTTPSLRPDGQHIIQIFLGQFRFVIKIKNCHWISSDSIKNINLLRKLNLIKSL